MTRRNFLTAIFLFVASLAAADTTTTNFGFIIPSTGSTNWAAKVDDWVVKLDTGVPGLKLANTFVASNTFTAPMLLTASSITLTGSTGYISAQSSITTTGAFFGDGSHLSNIPSSPFNGGTVSGQTTFQSTVTVQGSGFSVGGSSFSIAGGSGTVAYSLGANSIVINRVGSISSLALSAGSTGGLYFNTVNTQPGLTDGTANIHVGNGRVYMDNGSGPNLEVYSDGHIHHGSASNVCWSSTGNSDNACDANVSRLTSGVVQIGTGTTSNAGGSLAVSSISATGSVTGSSFTATTGGVLITLGGLTVSGGGANIGYLSAGVNQNGQNLNNAAGTVASPAYASQNQGQGPAGVYMTGNGQTDLGIVDNLNVAVRVTTSPATLPGGDTGMAQTQIPLMISVGNASSGTYVTGRLGVNTTAPIGQVDVRSSTGPANYVLMVSSQNATLMFGVQGNGNLFLDSASTITTGGLVYISSSASSGTYQVAFSSITGTAYNTQYNSNESTTTTTVNWNTGNVQYIVLANGAQSFTFNNPASGGRYVLIIVQPASGGAGTVSSWPANVKWPGGGTPTLTATNNKTDIITFVYDAFNARYYGATSLNY